MKLLSYLGMTVMVGLTACMHAGAQPVKLGAATYFLSPKGGDPVMPAAVHRTEALQKTAAQTN